MEANELKMQMSWRCEIKTTDYTWQYQAFIQFGLKLGKICKIDREKVFEGITHLFSKLDIPKDF